VRQTTGSGRRPSSRAGRSASRYGSSGEESRRAMDDGRAAVVPEASSVDTRASPAAVRPSCYSAGPAPGWTPRVTDQAHTGVMAPVLVATRACPRSRLHQCPPRRRCRAGPGCRHGRAGHHRPPPAAQHAHPVGRLTPARQGSGIGLFASGDRGRAAVVPDGSWPRTSNGSSIHASGAVAAAVGTVAPCFDGGHSLTHVEIAPSVSRAVGASRALPLDDQGRLSCARMDPGRLRPAEPQPA
jgi:hypothetical protein